MRPVSEAKPLGEHRTCAANGGRIGRQPRSNDGRAPLSFANAQHAVHAVHAVQIFIFGASPPVSKCHQRIPTQLCSRAEREWHARDLTGEVGLMIER